MLRGPPRYSFGLVSSRSLCSEFRSPQRIKTPAKAKTKKMRQNPSQIFRQRMVKSSIVVNMAVMKKSNPASAEAAIFVITVRSSILNDFWCPKLAFLNNRPVRRIIASLECA